MRRTFALAGLLSLSFGLPPSMQEPLKVQPNAENVVASRLEGTWVTAPALNEQLGGGSEMHESLAFKGDKAPAFLTRLPEKIASQLAKHGPIYLAGTLTIRLRQPIQEVRSDPASAWQEREFPFLLLTMNGNPHVVYFRPRDGDPLGDAESFNVALAPAKDPKNDLLFTGGDFNNQGYSALRRKSAPSAPAGK